MWKFKPILKSTIWGGSRICRLKSFDNTSDERIGESWEISDIPGDESVVSEGSDKGLTLHELIGKYGIQLMGDAMLTSGGRFPLMVKIIDATDDLSVQVHPNSAAAAGHGGDEKNEMWYVMDASDGARLINGFSKPVSPELLREVCGSADILPLLRHNEVRPGTAFFIPAGRIHSIGSGVLLVEIQQTSDTTYRVYDYDRIDKRGVRRELHIGPALKSINHTDAGGYPVDARPRPGGRTCMVDSSYFTANVISGKQGVPFRPDYSDINSFKIITMVEGYATIVSGDEEAVLASGNTLLLAAEEKDVILHPGAAGFVAVETYKK